MEKLVSVIIPIFNVVDYLQQSVESILDQTYVNLQVILVDDGSTDGSSHLAEILKRNDSRIELIHKKNEGLSSARNVGLSIATGEYAYFFDSDDLAESNLIEESVRFLETNNADFVTFTHDVIDNRNQYVRGKINNQEYKLSRIVSNEDLISKVLTGKIRVAAWSYIFRREVFTGADIKFQVGKKYEDNDTTLLLILASTKSGILKTKDVPYYHYRKRKDSITGHITRSSYDDLISMTNSVVQIIKKNTDISYAIDFYILNQYLSAFRILRVTNGTKEEYLRINNIIKKNISIRPIVSSKKTMIKVFYWIFWNTVKCLK